MDSLDEEPGTLPATATSVNVRHNRSFTRTTCTTHACSTRSSSEETSAYMMGTPLHRLSSPKVSSNTITVASLYSLRVLLCVVSTKTTRWCPNMWKQTFCNSVCRQCTHTHMSNATSCIRVSPCWKRTWNTMQKSLRSSPSSPSAPLHAWVGLK